MKNTMKMDDKPALSEAQLAQLQALEDIAPDTDDIPEAPAANWRDARRFYRPIKEPISIGIDADVLDWLRRRSERYQVEINRILRKEMEAELTPLTVSGERRTG